MINSLEIENFQSHKDSVIEFNKGLNIITGASDSGKSAIIRALLWVINNKPLGDDFKNWDNPEAITRVGIEFDDGELSKERGKSNVYITQSGNLEAFRSEIPEEVQEITKITDYNIQTQHQPYFLLQDSPGEVARKLNELVGLDVIDKLYKNINTKITSTKSSIEHTKSIISDLESDLEKYAHIELISALIEKLDVSVKKKEIVEIQRVSVRGLCVSVADLNSKIENQKKILKAEAKMKVLKEKLVKQVQLKYHYFSLHKIISDLEEIKTKTKNEREWLTVEPLYKSLGEKLDKKTELGYKADELENWKNNLNLVNASIEYNKKDLKTYQTEYIKLLKEHKICPICLSPIDNETLNRITFEGYLDENNIISDYT